MWDIGSNTYLFVFGASIKGYAYMRKVVMVDGTHLKEKYAGYLLTASTQDGNYQIFPLASAIVVSENYSVWPWLFNKLYAIVPNTNDMVFVSYMHASIYSSLKHVRLNKSHAYG